MKDECTSFNIGSLTGDTVDRLILEMFFSRILTVLYCKIVLHFPFLHFHVSLFQRPRHSYRNFVLNETLKSSQNDECGQTVHFL